MNSCEAAYFDYDDRKLLEIVKGAAELGADMFALDDGRFGQRNFVTTSLGDWNVNEEEIRCGLPALCQVVNDLGLKFGIWIESEMISQESTLYRHHPDWVYVISGRPPISNCYQYVLDFLRQETVDNLFVGHDQTAE